MKKIMVLSQNEELIQKIKPTPNVVLVYNDFMTIFEQLNFHSPDYIVFDFSCPCINHSQAFMLESLPKKDEENYIKIVAIGSTIGKSHMADFALKFDNVASLDVTVF